MSEPSAGRPSRLINFTPLRYPGGNGKLAAFVKRLIEVNDLSDGDYVEPYAGGAAIALELLFQEYVARIHINDISKPIYAFWRSVLDHTDEMAQRVRDTEVSVKTWDRQKRIFSKPSDHSILDLGFATFFLNRTNRSGILNAGIIGGRDQSGPWKIDARYNNRELANRIEAIGRQRHRISLTNLDAVKFLKRGAKAWSASTMVYLDPPYFEKGRDLYYDFYKPEDHAVVAESVLAALSRQKWIVSYDNVPEIRALYAKCRSIVYTIGYSARSTKSGTEVMFFHDGLKIPDLAGPLSLVEQRDVIAA